jgi:LemA protein
MKAFLIIAAICAAVGFYGCSTYNRLVGADEAVKAQWAQVESAYQRRADLVPNLVQTVKGYTAHEKEVLEAVSQARAQVGGVHLDAQKLSDQQAVERFEQAQTQLSGALGRLLAVSERYPDLKAQPLFANLQSQLEGTENRISVERRKYNETVQDYNVRVRSFPGSTIAGLGHFEAKVPFRATTPGAAEAPKVQF